jgi:DNA adenine methylase
MRYAPGMSTATYSRIPSPLKTHGGKRYLASRIVALFPPHLHYVEAFAGGLSVLLARDPADSSLWLAPHRGVSEVVNDLDGRLTNFWSVLQVPATFDRFRRVVEAMPLSRAEWERAKGHAYGSDPVADAVAFFVLARQSLAGRQRDFTALTRNRTRRGMNGNVSEWLGAVEGLPLVHERVRLVAVENKPAVEVIAREDGPGTLHYADPPYVPLTRTARKVYANEMTEGQHRDLLDVLRSVRGKVILSGYANGLYDRTLASWNRETFDLPNNAAGGRSKRRMAEVVWMNY